MPGLSFKVNRVEEGIEEEFWLIYLVMNSQVDDKSILAQLLRKPSGAWDLE